MNAHICFVSFSIAEIPWTLIKPPLSITTIIHKNLGVLKTQTSKPQTPDPKNSDPRVSWKLRPRKTQTLGCLENSDPKNSDPWMSRKLRPEKLRPSGCLENSDPKNKTYLRCVNAASWLVYCSSIQWHYHNLPRKEKQFIVSWKFSAATVAVDISNQIQPFRVLILPSYNCV